eukprot:3938926-Rhodomonas_salina.1
MAGCEAQRWVHTSLSNATWFNHPNVRSQIERKRLRARGQITSESGQVDLRIFRNSAQSVSASEPCNATPDPPKTSHCIHRAPGSPRGTRLAVWTGG